MVSALLCRQFVWLVWHGISRFYTIGPIIRVSPEEIHISDPLFYYELFVPSNVRRTNAYYRYARGTGFEGE